MEWQTVQFTSNTDDANTFIKNRLKSAFNLQDNEIDVEVDDGIITVTMNGKDCTYDTKVGNVTSELAVAKVKAGQTAPMNSNALYKSGEFTTVIPAGYTVSSTLNSIENGLVVTKDGNEWVWVPVSSEELAEMYVEDETG